MEFVLGKIKLIGQFLRRNYLVVLIIILTIPAIWDLIQPGFFPMHDDLQVFRLFELNKCFKDFQFPCRWVPDAGFGYGYPLMQFYPPMPYYPMELLYSLGAGLFWSVKIMFALAFVVSGIGMYLLAKELFGVWGGIFSAVLYTYAPYHSVDIYVRGALNEAWGMAWFPFVLLYIYKLIKDQKRRSNLLLLGVFLGLQLTSHNVMTLVFAPTALIWAVYWLVVTKQYQATLKLVQSGVLGVCLSAFFFVPVLLEQKFVHVDSMVVGYFNYLAHFADLKQLFISRFWGYGGSTWGPEDGMSFSVGTFQWVFSFLAGLVAVIKFPKNKFMSLAVLFMLFSGLGYAFLTHSRSVYFWDHLPLLQYSQFPWRLVALVVFYFSLSAGFVFNTLSLSSLQKTFLLAPLVLSIITYNLTYFRVDKHLKVTVEEKLSGLQWENQVTGGIFDYLPRTAPKPPGDPAFTIPQFVEGLGGITDFRSGTNWQSFTVHASTKSAKVMLPLYTYAGLKVKVNKQPVKTEIDPDLGRVIVQLNQEYNFVEAKIGYTPVRLFSDLLSLGSVLYLIYLAKKNHG